MSLVSATAGNATMGICNCTGECMRTGRCGANPYSLGRTTFTPYSPNVLGGAPCFPMDEMIVIKKDLSQRLEKVESICRKLETELANHIQYLADASQAREKLRQEFRTFYVERFKELEKKVAIGKTPHGCPLCSGTGKNYIDPAKPLSGFESMLGQRDERGMSYLTCKPCKGEGIVWG